VGIVVKHSAWNLGMTAVGFLLGAANTLLLATQYLDDDYYGLWGYVLSTAFLLFPLMSFGIHNTLVKFYSSYQLKEERDAFLTQMLVLPLLIILPGLALVYLWHTEIAALISRINPMVGDYVWHIAAIAIFQAYFEIFYAWVKVQMKTIGGNFIKEVFYRAAATLLLLLVMLDVMTQVQFIDALVIVYLLRCMVMMLLALRTYRPIFKFMRSSWSRDIFNYSLLMIIAGSVGTALIDLDKYMINQYLDIDTISYYGVAVYIATVIAVPSRGMSQITHPLTAGFYNRNDMKSLESLYKRSSLNLSIISGFLMVIILCNVYEFYKFLPEEFSVAIPVVFIISLVKFAENIAGSNNAILYNSNLYKVTLWLGLGLAIIAVLLNILLIPEYGLLGAAISTCIAFLTYTITKVWYVNYKLKVHPWTPDTWKVMLLILATLLIFVFWNFHWNIYINIALKSTLITAFYGWWVYKLKMSAEISGLIFKYLPFLKDRD
jgi:O-antigen/teichoic acid export membrane protein